MNTRGTRTGENPQWGICCGKWTHAPTLLRWQTTHRRALPWLHDSHIQCGITLPNSLLKSFSLELAVPVTSIFKVPNQWKEAEVNFIPVPKTSPIMDINSDLRQLPLYQRCWSPLLPRGLWKSSTLNSTQKNMGHKKGIPPLMPSSICSTPGTPTSMVMEKLRIFLLDFSKHLTRQTTKCS